MRSFPTFLSIAAGLLLIAAAIGASLFGWMTGNPWTKAGGVKRSLDAVSKEAKERDREIEELTRP